MVINFKEFLDILNIEFKDCVGMEVEYFRSDVPINKLQIFLQYFLDPLCITEFNFIVTSDGIKIKTFKYEDKIGFGEIPTPYDIVLLDETKPISQKNIKEINIFLI
jgi:hypothetical protein